MRLPTRLLQRKSNAQKRDFGHILILAGSARFSGAASLCAESALRAGSGLVTLGIPKSLNSALIKIKPKEVMTLPLPETKQGALSQEGYRKIIDFIKHVDVLIIGPGLAREKSTQGLVRKILGATKKPTVIDADGLFALSGHLPLLKRQGAEKILTPHCGEMARLLGGSINKIQGQRKEIAQDFAKDYKVTMVLKGHRTVVADYKGNLYINKTGNPGMATAGSGDVLTGIIGAFLGQGLDAFAAAKYAVYLHGLAGDLAAEEKTQISLIASDIIAKIPAAIKKSN
jgi:NAD(P)H-hydrate epimerase